MRAPNTRNSNTRDSHNNRNKLQWPSNWRERIRWIKIPHKTTMDLIPIETANERYPQLMLEHHQKKFST
jgi:hypothetical protein